MHPKVKKLENICLFRRAVFLQRKQVELFFLPCEGQLGMLYSNYTLSLYFCARQLGWIFLKSHAGFDVYHQLERNSSGHSQRQGWRPLFNFPMRFQEDSIPCGYYTQEKEFLVLALEFQMLGILDFLQTRLLEASYTAVPSILQHCKTFFNFRHFEGPFPPSYFF